MPALWIAHVTVTDEEAYSKYAALATEAIAAHGGKFIARGGRFVQLGRTGAPTQCGGAVPFGRGGGRVLQFSDIPDVH